MSNTGRLLGWILPGLLCCGGCATSALVESPQQATPRVATEDTAARGAVAPTDSAPGPDRLDAAAISQAAQKSGIPADQATQLAVFLDAYGEMNRQAGQTPAGQVPWGNGVDGIPVSEAAAAFPAPSPASVTTHDSGASPTVASHQNGQTQSPRPATSVYTADHASGNLRKPRAPAPELTVELHPPAQPSAASDRQGNVVRADPPQGLKDDGGQAGDHRADPSETEAGPAETSAATHGDDPQSSWSKQLRLAMEQLRNDLESETMDEEQRARSQVCLSLLHLAVEDPEKAVETLKDLDDQQLEFWRQTVMGMGILLDSNELPKFRHRVESAADHLSKGVSALSSLGPLRLSNLSFCTKVDGFGDFVECSAYGLEPGKPVLLYVEVENATAEPVPAGTAHEARARDVARRSEQSPGAASRYVTELHGRYEILDANQRSIVSRTLPVGGDTCRNQRRDFYISYVLYLPENIEPGAYTLELTIEDKKGGKFGNAVVDFRIR